MDRLPMELLCTVFEHLQDLDLASTLHSELLEEPTYRLVFAYANLPVYEIDSRSTSWLNLNNVSRAAILNARLTSTALYHASHKTFARLLADRTFRLTNVGIQDLTLISRKKELLHHIRILALGCAFFAPETCINKSDCMCPEFLAGLEMRDHARLAAAYTKCREWQLDFWRTRMSDLASMLGSIPNLDSIRILTFDRPFHLGGWLEPGDEDLLHRDLYLHHDRSFEELRPDPFEMHQHLYVNECEVIVDKIMEAIKGSKLAIRDFRADSRCVPDNALAPMLTPSLHTLRIILSKTNASSLDSSMWSGLLGQATSLRDLSLGNEDHQCSYTPSDVRLKRLRRQEPSGDLLLKALKDHKQLRRVKLHGGWAFSESAIVEFVVDHAETLRCFLLDETLLFGSWLHASKKIQRAMFQKAFLMRIRSSAESQAVNAHVQILEETVWVEQQSV